MPNQITNGLSQTKSNKQSLSNFYLKPAFDKSPTVGHRMPLLLFSFWEVTMQSDAKLQKTKGNFGKKISSQFVNFTKFTVKSWSVYWVRRWLKTGQELTFMIYPQTSLSPTFCPNISEKELPLVAKQRWSCKSSWWRRYFAFWFRSISVRYSPNLWKREGSLTTRMQSMCAGR